CCPLCCPPRSAGAVAHPPSTASAAAAAAQRIFTCIGTLLLDTLVGCRYSSAMRTPILAMLLVLPLGCSRAPVANVPASLPLASIHATPFPASPDEPHLRNLRMLTHLGENAEAYFSA